ncbi:MAG TPA: T9SS type A sorting domain-containing protein [Bacteroidales bacterium]|nr:T9SS type A sorting domain-containing protein [Bacteroidales bacterium]
MKKFAILFFVFHFSFFTFHFASAQWGSSCLPEGITIQEQTQVDSFHYYYPGCTEIEGGVYINGGVYNLNGLLGLETIGGDLSISCVQFTDMAGLDSLKTIGGSLTFYDTQLTDMSGLGALETVGGDFTIGCFTNTGLYCNNPYLENLSGLQDLQSIGGTLTVQYCESLTNIDDLAGLTQVSRIYIKANPILNSVEGLANIYPDSLVSLTIAGNPSLNSCEVESLCSFLDDPAGQINIYDNGTGCDNPVEIATACGVELSCLPYGNYWLLSQADINSFPQDFPDCNEINGTIYVIGGDIVNLEPLNQVNSVHGALILGHEWYGGGNPVLENLQGLENIDSITGTLHIQYCPMLDDLSELQNLSFVGGTLQLVSNDGLTRLSGLEGLTSIGSGIDISANDRLKDLSGLENVTDVGSGILIRLNDSLASLAGIDNISAGSISLLNIYFNDMLSECDVASICEYLAAPNGEIDISGNAPGCNSPEEVLEECAVGVEESSVVGRQSSVVSYPNPTDGLTQFQISIFDFEHVSLTIYNAQGQEVVVVLDEKMAAGEHTVRWDAGELPAGIYFYQVRAKSVGQVSAGKIVKY